jgi:hypothetical protein
VTRKKRTPQQKLARKIQRETGEPYAACLARVQRMIPGVPAQRTGGS